MVPIVAASTAAQVESLPPPAPSTATLTRIVKETLLSAWAYWWDSVPLVCGPLHALKPHAVADPSISTVFP